jgi:hypothetical protein
MNSPVFKGSYNKKTPKKLLAGSFSSAKIAGMSKRLTHILW